MLKRNKKKHQLEPEALQQSKRLRDQAQSRASSTKNDSDGGAHHPEQGYVIQINVICGDGTPPLAYAWQAGIIANLISDETHHIPMPSRVEVLSDQDAVLYWPKPLCQREAQEVVDAVGVIEKWAGKEAAISVYALSVPEVEELVKREW